MGVSFASYEIARSGLYVNERALYVTGHNISNVNTPGYVRQQAIIQNGPTVNIHKGPNMFQMGLGADIQRIRQIRHSFLDNVYRQENTTLGYWEARTKTLQDVQSVMSEPMEAGLQNVMNQFWDSWQELSKEPDSLTVRALVRQRGEAFAHHVNHMSSQLDKLQEDLNSEIMVRIDEINDITDKIVKLNEYILKAETAGDSPNDYRDQRNTLVDRLTKLVNCEVYEANDGQLQITVGGYFLVNKSESTNLVAEEKTTGSIFYVPKLEGTNIEVPVKNGILKGLLESRGEVFGEKGSMENGSPNTKADIVFAVDITSTTDALAKIKSNIQSYVDELDRSGIDYNLRLITYGDTVYSNDDFGKDAALLEAAIPSVPNGDGNNNFGGAGGVIQSLEGTAFRNAANRYAFVFTGESIDGNGITGSGTAYGESLNALGIKTSVFTDSGYFNAGYAGDTGENGWDSITLRTGGKLYDINTAASDFADLLTGAGTDTAADVDSEISVIEESANIISTFKKRINSLINIMVRQVNYLHQSGKTMGNPPVDGESFFTAINSKYPLEMGNIKINDNLTNLNNIVASQSDASGDNTIALQIANLRHAKVMKDSSGLISIDEYYQNIILDVGYMGFDAERIMSNQTGLVNAAHQQRVSVTGVSMDEEMTNMMRYKFAYNAASKAINAVDEMIRTIIERTGIAGR